MGVCDLLLRPLNISPAIALRKIDTVGLLLKAQLQDFLLLKFHGPCPYVQDCSMPVGSTGTGSIAGVVAGPWLGARCPPKPLYHCSTTPLHKWSRERKHNQRIMSQERERSQNNYHQNRFSLGMLMELLTNQNHSRKMRSKTNIKNTFPPLIAPSRSLPPLSSWAMGFMVSSLHLGLP